MIFLKDRPSLIIEERLDMRFFFTTKSGGYSFINPLVKEVFVEQYLTVDAIERFMRERHHDITGSLFARFSFSIVLKAKARANRIRKNIEISPQFKD